MNDLGGSIPSSTEGQMRPIDPHYNRWIGKELIKVADEIRDECEKHGYEFSVLDPEINTHNIDVEPNRLNVRVDRDSVITGLNFG